MTTNCVFIDCLACAPAACKGHASPIESKCMVLSDEERWIFRADDQTREEYVERFGIGRALEQRRPCSEGVR